MEKFTRLINTQNGSNKYYELKQKNSSTLTATYGRIKSTVNTYDYPMSKWDSIVKSKLAKGYIDVTDSKTTTKYSIEELMKNLDLLEEKFRQKELV